MTAGRCQHPGRVCLFSPHTAFFRTILVASAALGQGIAQSMVCAHTGCVLSKLHGQQHPHHHLVPLPCLGVWGLEERALLFTRMRYLVCSRQPMYPTDQGHPLRVRSECSQVSWAPVKFGQSH